MKLEKNNSRKIKNPRLLSMNFLQNRYI